MKITTKTAEEIIEHHFGKKPKEVSEVPGGLANFVYDVLIDDDRYVVRISDEASKLQYFLKEQWAVEKVRELKVPVPEILEVGNEASKFPYMIVRHVAGRVADTAPTSEREAIVREMGKYAAIINSIPTHGFGHVFDWSSNQLSLKETWKDFLDKELNVEKCLGIFEDHKIFENGQLTRLKSAFREIGDWNYKPSLNHGDLRLKNLLLNEKGKIIAILDWEYCNSNIAPYWEMAMALHDLTVDERDAFIDGYGMTQQEYRRISVGIKALNIINYAPFVEMAEAEKKDERRKQWLDNLRTRLRGGYDLYSL